MDYNISGDLSVERGLTGKLDVSYSGSGYAIGDGLKIVDGKLTVDTATEVEEDNTKPVTSGAVYEAVNLVMPALTPADDGKVLTAISGKWVAAELPKYTGAYAVTPAVYATSVPTAQKYMEGDITIKAIPYYDVSNTAGGNTVYIGEELG